MAQFFINRPIFAWVIAIIIMLGGALSIVTLPLEQYHDIAPPRVTIGSQYTGASAETVENSVTQIIEQQLKGIDNMLYMSSTSDASGRSRTRSPSPQAPTSTWRRCRCRTSCRPPPTACPTPSRAGACS